MKNFGIEIKGNDMNVYVFENDKKICTAKFFDTEIKTLLEEELVKTKNQLEIYIIDYVNYLLYTRMSTKENEILREKIKIYVNNYFSK